MEATEGPIRLGVPTSFLTVRGPGLRPTWIRSNEIPAEAEEYERFGCSGQGLGEWRNIPGHWRKLEPLEIPEDF